MTLQRDRWDNVVLVTRDGATDAFIKTLALTAASVTVAGQNITLSSSGAAPVRTRGLLRVGA